MFDKFVAKLREQAARFPDVRKGGNHESYTVTDACLSAFSVFFTQSPSFLAYQIEMRERKGKDNAQSLFGVAAIPSDNEIRNLLDPVAPSYLAALYWETLKYLTDEGLLDHHRGYAGQWLCALDGVQFFSSTNIQCAECSQRQQGNKTTYTQYTHSGIAPVMVAPEDDYVVSLEPEFITPQDGVEKQDCEQAAVHRWVKRNAQRFAAHSVTVLTDDLHSRQPTCALLLSHGLNFIMVCKPESHPFMYEQIDELSRLNTVTQCVDKHWTGRYRELWTYRFVNDVLLRNSADALAVNWCELVITRADTPEILYRNSFVTNHRIDDKNVAAIVSSGRARWKTENENHNTLKNHGYHLEHNFGHGKQHLANFLLALNLLAFLLHTALALTETAYQRIRQTLVARKRFFNDIRTLTHYMHFASWVELMTFMYHGLEIEGSP